MAETRNSRLTSQSKQRLMATQRRRTTMLPPKSIVLIALAPALEMRVAGTYTGRGVHEAN